MEFSQSVMRSTARVPRAWKTASTRLSVSATSAAKESNGTPPTATGKTMSAPVAAGDSVSSVMTMTLAPRDFASATISWAAAS